MKLYLSSYKIGNNPQALAELIGENKRIAIVPNALDVYTDMERRAKNLEAEKKTLVQIGLAPEELDLRVYFGKPEDLYNKLKEFGAVWVLGGNSFTLRRAYKESGMDDWLLQNRENKDFVYSGYSAGVCVLSPSLKGIEFTDSPNIVPEGYKPDIIWEGLGLISFAFAPHFESDHPESESVNKEVEYYKQGGIEHRTLSDGEVIIMDTEDSR